MGSAFPLSPVPSACKLQCSGAVLLEHEGDIVKACGTPEPSLKVEFVSQPPLSVGGVLLDLLAQEPPPDEVVLVSAFSTRTTAIRLRKKIQTLLTHGASVRVVLGVGASSEALEEVLAWSVDARIVLDRNHHHTFHPKLYFVAGPQGADLIAGSSNLTEGGLFRNFESAVHITYDLPADQPQLDYLRRSLVRFLDPTGPTARPLDADLLTLLQERGLVASEKESQPMSGPATAPETTRATPSAPELPFGTEAFPPAPPFDTELLKELQKTTARVRRQKRDQHAADEVLVVSTPVSIEPLTFYMHLPKLQGPNIPGEARIPYPARDIASTFWGWPDNYTREMKQQGETPREYLTWKPAWIITDASASRPAVVQSVRMYDYSASSDFRFYSGALVELGADSGDIVRIRRLDGADAQYECTLARRGTVEHGEWERYCSIPIRNSDRRWGYA